MREDPELDNMNLSLPNFEDVGWYVSDIIRQFKAKVVTCKFCRRISPYPDLRLELRGLNSTGPVRRVPGNS